CGRGGGAVWTAARGRQRGSASNAERNQLEGSRAWIHQASEGRRGEADGIRPPRLQELRSAREDNQADRGRSVRGYGQEPSAGHCARVGAYRAGGRLLRFSQALSERRLLLGNHLPGDELSG